MLGVSFEYVLYSADWGTEWSSISRVDLLLGACQSRLLDWAMCRPPLCTCLLTTGYRQLTITSNTGQMTFDGIMGVVSGQTGFDDTVVNSLPSMLVYNAQSCPLTLIPPGSGEFVYG